MRTWCGGRGKECCKRVKVWNGKFDNGRVPHTIEATPRIPQLYSLVVSQLILLPELLVDVLAFPLRSWTHWSYAPLRTLSGLTGNCSHRNAPVLSNQSYDRTTSINRSNQCRSLPILFVLSLRSKLLFFYFLQVFSHSRKFKVIGKMHENTLLASRDCSIDIMDAKMNFFSWAPPFKFN